MNDKHIENLWRKFANVNLDIDDEVISEDFEQFEKGSDKLEIWKWFDDCHSKGVYWLMHNLN